MISVHVPKKWGSITQESHKPFVLPFNSQEVKEKGTLTSLKFSWSINKINAGKLERPLILKQHMEMIIKEYLEWGTKANYQKRWILIFSKINIWKTGSKKFIKEAELIDKRKCPRIQSRNINQCRLSIARRSMTLRKHLGFHKILLLCLGLRARRWHVMHFRRYSFHTTKRSQLGNSMTEITSKQINIPKCCTLSQRWIDWLSDTNKLNVNKVAFRRIL